VYEIVFKKMETDIPEDEDEVIDSDDDTRDVRDRWIT
jgi:hypothetical protein